MLRKLARTVAFAILATVTLSNSAIEARDVEDRSFTIAVIPDTQNYVDFSHQTEAGFPFDARELFFAQMAYIARNSRAAGGDIVFATALGDVWQHASERMDADHVRRGFKAVVNPIVDSHFAPDPRVETIEMPTARAGYDMIAGLLPFSVVPGNHDYDASWTDARHPPSQTEPFGTIHYGGLSNFTRVFGATSPFFAGKPWYVGSFRDGADSAQVFEAGDYRFLHIGLEMAPDDAALDWASGIIAAHPGLPTIVTTHDFLNAMGERKPLPGVDMALVDPVHNGPEAVWRKFIAAHDQIFLVLCGHQNGQAHRIDPNNKGHAVIQILSDYQDRNQTLATATGTNPAHDQVAGQGVGDGWMRLLTFDMSAPVPMLSVRTWSTHYGATAAELPRYADFYKRHERPNDSDRAFLGREEFRLPLTDFRARFGPGGR